MYLKSVCNYRDPLTYSLDMLQHLRKVLNDDTKTLDQKLQVVEDTQKSIVTALHQPVNHCTTKTLKYNMTIKPDRIENNLRLLEGIITKKGAIGHKRSKVIEVLTKIKYELRKQAENE